MARKQGSIAFLQPSSASKEKEGQFLNLPTSPAQHTLYELLGAGADETAQLTFMGRKKQLDRHTELEIYELGDSRQVKLKSRSENLTLELEDINKLTGSNGAAKDFLLLYFTKLPEQALFNGELCKESLVVTPKELVELGLYGRTQEAKRAFEQASRTLTSIKLMGSFKVRGKKEDGIYTDSVKSLRVLFTGYDSARGQCILHLNPLVNWEALARFFAPYPRWGFRLSRKAKDLLYYIFYLARVKKSEIAEKGGFTISYRALQASLHLPSEERNGNPYRTIKEPLERAITEIEEVNAETDNELQLTLTPHPALDNTSKLPIKDFLDSGYLEVGISGDYAAIYKELHARQQLKIEKNTKRREKAKEKAIQASLLEEVQASKKGGSKG